MRLVRTLGFALAALVSVLLQAASSLQAAETDAESSMELDFWFNLDKEKTTRLLFLNSWARDSEHNFSETVFGVALDYKLGPSWSLRAGVRRVTQESDPPSEETRAVLDVKYALPLGEGWILTDRARVDLRLIDGGAFSARFRDRVMMEKAFTVFTREITGFASYELFYDTREQALSRQNLSLGVSVPLADWVALGVFFTKSFAITPPKNTVGSVGLSLELTF